MSIKSTSAKPRQVTTRPAANKPAPKKPAAGGKKPATGWNPKPPKRADTAPLKSVGWAPQDSNAKVAGTFTAKGAGLKSVTLGEDGKATLVGNDGKKSTVEFGIGNGGAAFMDTLVFKQPDGSMRLFGVSEVQRDATGKVTSLQLGEFVNGSPTNIEPLTLTR